MLAKTLPSVMTIPTTSSTGNTAPLTTSTKTGPEQNAKRRISRRDEGLTLRKSLTAALALFSVGAQAKPSARIPLPMEMLQAYQKKQGALEKSPVEVLAAILNKSGQLSIGKLQQEMGIATPESIHNGLNWASFCGNQGRSIQESIKNCLNNEPALCQLENTRPRRVQCNDVTEPTKDQMEKINVARLAAAKMISPYTKGVADAVQGVTPVMMSNSPHFKAGGVTASTAMFGDVKNGANVYSDHRVIHLSSRLADNKELMTTVMHEECHAHCHPRFLAELESHSATSEQAKFRQWMIEPLTERIASEWSQDFGDTGYEKGGSHAFAESIIHIMAKPSEAFPKGGHKAAMETLKRAWFSGDAKAIKITIDAINTAQEMTVDQGLTSAEGLPEYIASLYEKRQGRSIHHDELFSSNDEMPAQEAVKNGFFQGENLQGVAFGALTAAALTAGAVVAARAASAKDKTGAPQEGTEEGKSSEQQGGDVESNTGNDIYFDSLQYQDVPKNKLPVAALLKEPDLAPQMQSLTSILPPQANN